MEGHTYETLVKLGIAVPVLEEGPCRECLWDTGNVPFYFLNRPASWLGGQNF
jgi:hypothetical protein